MFAVTVLGFEGEARKLFLTKKARKKSLIYLGLFIALGCAALIVAGIFSLMLIKSTELIIIGVISLVLGVVVYFSGRYTEGKGKLLINGNKLINNELRPAEFIRAYEEARDCPDNVVSKPDFDILSLVTAAYGSLDENEKALETIEQMIAAVPEKKKAHAQLLKAAVLFDMGKTEEAEELFNRVQSEKLNLITKGMADTILKSDRARAMGDYKTAENYYNQVLTRTFPKNTPLSLVATHYNLADIYCRTDRTCEAKTHLEYCVQNGGETAIKKDAEEKLKVLSN